VSMTISRAIGPLTYWLRVPTARSRDRQPVFGCEGAHSRVLVRDLRRLLEALRVVARVIEPQRGPRPALPRHRTLPGLYHLAAHLQSPRPHRTRRPTTATGVADLSGQNICRGYPTGVALLLLSPSASPERVWLYAAELNERFARAAHSESILCGQETMIPGIPGCATKDAPIGLGNTKSLEHQAK